MFGENDVRINVAAISSEIDSRWREITSAVMESMAWAWTDAWALVIA
jgi:hypothetical protein